MMTGASSPMSGNHFHALHAEARLLARALRGGRLNVLVGASGVGKTSLLVAGVLPLLRRRVGDERNSQGGAPQTVAPVTDRRARVRGRGEGELLHFVDGWSEPSLDLLARALGEVPASAPVEVGLAQAMSPARLSAHSLRHGGARLLFVLDHVESLIEGARHEPHLEALLGAWLTAVQARDLDAHFLVAVDEQAWPRFQALLAKLPATDLLAFHLQERSGRRVLANLQGFQLQERPSRRVLADLQAVRLQESSGRQELASPTAHQPGSAEAKPRAATTELEDSIEPLPKAAQSVRSAASRRVGLAASLSTMVPHVSNSTRAADPTPSSGSNSATGQGLAPGLDSEPTQASAARMPVPDLNDPSRERDPATEEAARLAAVDAERRAHAAQRAEEERIHEATARAVAARRTMEAGEAARQLAEAHAAAGRAVEAQRAAQAQQAAEAAKTAEAEGRARAAEELAAQEMRARQEAEEAARAARAVRLAEAALLVETKRRAEEERYIAANRQAEAVRQVVEARDAEVRKLTHALAAAEAAAARELRARQTADAAAKTAADQQWAEAVRRAEAERRADAYTQAEAAQRAEMQRLAAALAAVGADAAVEEQSRRAADRQPPVLEELPTCLTTIPPMRPRDLDTADGRLAPDAAAARSARPNLLWRAGAVAAVAAVVAVVLWWFDRRMPPATPMARSTEAAAPLPGADSALGRSPASADTSAPAPPLPGRYELVGSTAGSTHSRLALELAGALSNKAQAVQLVPTPDAPDAITGLQTQGRLAIVRFDTLRAARGTAAAPLRVLTPLFPQEVLFIVRADSPLKYIHELRGRRLGIGPAAGDEAPTVRAIYRSMFGKEMVEPARVDNDQALAELVAFRSIDAMAVVEPQPSVWWASLGPRTKRQLRLLTLDPRDPADQRLLQTPGTSRAPADTGSANDKQITTPAVMSFLVTSGSGDADAERMKTMAAALCRELPRLRKSAHPKWRELQTKAELDSGWPVDQQFRSVLDRCMRR